MKTWYRTWGVAVMAAALTLSACGRTDNKPEQPAAKQEPVTLNFFYNGFSESLTNQLKAKIEQKYPHITIHMILHGTGTTIDDTIAAGTKLDLAAFTMGQLFKVMELKLVSDMSDLVSKHSFDLNRLAPGVLDAVKGYSEKGEILVMPYELNNSVLLYNKSIFDKFGVAYPKDGVTWDEVTEMIRKTSRTENGVAYKGFSYSGANPVYKNQFGLPFVDPQTNKSALSHDGWQKWLGAMTSFYKIPNNSLEGNADNAFFKNKTMAMRTGPNPLDLLPAAIESGLDWDAATMPKFPANESSGSQLNAPFYLIPPASPHRDEAFQVIAYLMSDEMQTWNARQGRVPIVKSESVVQQFGADLPFLQGKNYTNAVFKEVIAKPVRVTRYDGIVRTELAAALAEVAQKGTDVNTALRSAEERANKLIAEQMK
ncbi:ABC transporter substrate-binding protein [Paenibacillus sp. GCM10012303]|jgi:multiple sugar transport system substrate-binding protein|uniref:ABC transporter substrate-binding protein n=1 Tax=Paenibacillus sp. GCM10012303 TaxID=3317340 RepID=UPI00360CA422